VHPKYIIVSDPKTPLIGTFVYGKVYNHRDLVKGYVKVHGGGWYRKDDEKRTMMLYGSSGDYGPGELNFLDRIPSELRGYTFLYSPDWGKSSVEIDTSTVEWV